MAHTLKVGWAGVGKLGAPMVQRLIDSGFDLVLFDTNPDNLARFDGSATLAPSLREMVEQGGDVIVTTIPNDTVLKAVALGDDGILAKLPESGIYVDMSTVSPEASADIAREAERCGRRYLRAPVSGSVMHAEQGILTVLCSGDAQAFDICNPVFDAFSAHAYHVGSGEEARYLKLVINNLVGSTATLLAESLALGRKGGLDWEVMLDVIANSAVASPLIKYKTGVLKNRDFTPAFTTVQMIKDVGLVTEAAKAAGCSTPLADQTLAIMKEQADSGLADEDFFAAVKLMENRAGLPPIEG